MAERSVDQQRPKSSPATSVKCAGCGHEFEVKVPNDGPLPISGGLGFSDAVFVSLRGKLREQRSFLSSPFTCPRCGLTN